MKRHLPLLIMVPLFLVTFYVASADTHTDPGLVKWLQDHGREIQTNRQLVNNERQGRIELENRLLQIMQNDSNSIRNYMRGLETRISNIERRLYTNEQAIQKLIQQTGGN